MRRLPPNKIEQNLRSVNDFQNENMHPISLICALLTMFTFLNKSNPSGLLNLIPEETDELLQRIDQPLTEETDVATVRFLI